MLEIFENAHEYRLGPFFAHKYLGYQLIILPRHMFYGRIGDLYFDWLTVVISLSCCKVLRGKRDM